MTTRLNRLMFTGAAAVVLLLTAWTLSLVAAPDRAEAQAASSESWQYGYLLPVPRVESYDIDLSRWAASPADKEYHRAHVFPYEEGASSFARRLNELKRMNELSAEGWEMVDTRTGLIRRRN